jgi:hypothetical protein
VAEADPSAAAAVGALGYSCAGLDWESEWWWRCPQHGDVRRASRGRHEEGGCGRILVPCTVWVDDAGTLDDDGDGDD